LRVNRTLDNISAEAALPQSPLIAAVRFEQSLRQGILPLLVLAVILVAHVVVSELVYGPGWGEVAALSPRTFTPLAAQLVDLFQLPVSMIWALAVLSATPHRPLIGALLPAVWFLFNPLSYVSYHALMPITGVIPMLQDHSTWDFGYLYNAELIPPFSAYLAFYAAGWVLMLLAIMLIHRQRWLAITVLSVQIAFLLFASETAKALSLWVANPVNNLPGGLPLEGLHRVGAVAYQPIVTSEWQIEPGYTPSLFFGYGVFDWAQLFVDYPLIILLIVMAINIAGLLLLKELAGWAVYRSARQRQQRSAD
jgi:hypothetical protein